MQTRLRKMIALLERLDVTPTIPVTAQTLERHPELKHEVGNVDPAVHGYRHVAYARLTPAEQGRDLDAARRVFADHGLPTRGFRAPYLSANATTRLLLARAGFLYDSSTPRFVMSPDDNLSSTVQKLAESRYGARIRMSIPADVPDGLVEIPVALPDDEILVDGLGLTNSQTIARVLSRMLDASSAERSSLVLQMHPERFPLIADALSHVVKRAVDLGAWRASLSEIAGRAARFEANSTPSFFFAVTGDLDAATVWDFAPRLRGHV